MLNDGVWQGERILPEGWVREATIPDAAPVDFGALPWGEPEGYQYQWYAIEGEDGAYVAEGVFGQLIYVNPTRKLVAAKASVWPSGWDNQLKREAWAAFDALARQLQPKEGS